MNLTSMVELARMLNEMLNEGYSLKDYYIGENNTITVILDNGEELKDFFFTM